MPNTPYDDFPFQLTEDQILPLQSDLEELAELLLPRLDEKLGLLKRQRRCE